MAWGGGGMAGGGGGFLQGSAGRPGGGLPFAGIPSELPPGGERLIAAEPEHGEPDVTFTHQRVDQRPLTLKRLVAPYWRTRALAGLLALVEEVSLHARPYLAPL